MQSLAQAEGGANADEDSHEVVNVFSTDPAPTSDFDEYLNSLHSAAAESSTSPAATADIKGGESSSQFRWFTIAKIEL